MNCYIWKFRLQYWKNLSIENIFNPRYITNQKKSQNTVYFKRLVERLLQRKRASAYDLINLYNSEAIMETYSAK